MSDKMTAAETQTPDAPEICAACRLPIHPDDVKRYCGWFTTHQHSRCIELLRQQLAEANGRAEKETRRADAWVKAARDLSRELGMADDESDGSIRDWQHIRSKLQMRLARAAEAELRAVRENGTCKWVYDGNEDYYATTCGGAFCLTDGTPEENNLKFCPYCSHLIDAALASTATGESHDGGREG